MTKKMNAMTLSLLDRMTAQERKLVESFADRHVAIGRCSEQLREMIRNISDQGLFTHEKILNSCLFLNMVAYDLSALLHEIIYERDEWKRKLSARNLAVLLFEIGEDLPTVFGKDFRASCTALGVTDDMLADFGGQMKKITELWNENRIDLKNIRKVVGAHRDHNAARMFDLIEKIDLFDFMGIGVKFGTLLNDLGTPSQKIMMFSASVQPPEKQIQG